MNSQTAHETLCLTSDQIADLLIANDPDVLSLASRRRHLHQCSTCRAEFLELEGLLGSLRESAIATAAEAQTGASAQALRRDSTIFFRPFAVTKVLWLATAAALAVGITFPLIHHDGISGPVRAVAAKATISSDNASPLADEALLEGISQDLAASVPSSLRPLADPASSFASQPVDDDATRR